MAIVLCMVLGAIAMVFSFVRENDQRKLKHLREWMDEVDRRAELAVHNRSPVWCTADRCLCRPRPDCKAVRPLGPLTEIDPRDCARPYPD